MKKERGQLPQGAGNGEKLHNEYRSPTLKYHTDGGLLKGARGAFADPLDAMVESLILSYRDKGWGYTSIANEVGVCRNSVIHVLRRNDHY
jgi:hypothetical protein